MVAAAIVGGALVGAVGAGVAGSEAASATTSSTNASIAEQNKILEQQSTLSQPYRDLGSSAIPLYEQLLGISPQAPAAPGALPPVMSGGPSDPSAGASAGYTLGGAGQIGRGVIPGGTPGAPGISTTSPVPGVGGPSGILSALEQTPGYQFALEQGDKGILNAASATGGVTGNTLTDLMKYNSGLAEGTYQQVLGDVGGAVGIGQAAAAGQASNLTTAGQTISSNLINQGNTIAGIDANTAAGITKAIGNAGDQYVTMQALQALNS